MYRLSAWLLCIAALPAAAFENSATLTVTPLLKATTSWDGKPIVYPAGQAEVTAMIIEIAPHADIPWHLHPVPSFGTVLEGTLDVELHDGRVKRLEAGQAVAEVSNTVHRGRNAGSTPVRLLVIYTGSVGQPLTVEQAAPAKP